MRARSRIVVVAIAPALVAACGGAPPRAQAVEARASDAPEPAAKPAPTLAPALADTPLTALAAEMCVLAFAAARGEPLPANRMNVNRVELHATKDAGTPEGPCLAVTFSVKSELTDAPQSPARIAQSSFLLTKRRVTAHAHAVGASPDIHVTPNTSALGELVKFHESFVAAVTDGRASAFQSSKLECDDVGIDEGGRCAREMLDPVAAPGLADAWREPLAKRKQLELDAVYVIAAAEDGLVRLRLSFQAPTLVLEAEHRSR